MRTGLDLQYCRDLRSVLVTWTMSELQRERRCAIRIGYTERAEAINQVIYSRLNGHSA